MLRTFPQFGTRFVESLDGRWEFVTAPDRTDRTKLPKTYNRTIQVPSCWETLPGLENYRGKAWLRTAIPALDGLAVRLVFGGIGHTADVYVDGKHVKHHYDAYTPFDIVLADLTPGGHELVVQADNSFHEGSSLHIENDYYSYGGITRPVEMQFVPEVYVDRLYATPKRNRGRWSLAVKVRLKNWSDQSHRRHVVLTLGEGQHDLGMLTVPAGGEKTKTITLEDLDVQPWTAETPNLYYLQAELLDGEDVVDDLVERIGFREAATRGKTLLLNGVPIRLRGYNRHEDHPHYGCSLPLEAMVYDLEILRDLGCNFIRTSHYPNDQRFLDLCDEMGFYVWEESHCRSYKPFEYDCFREQILAETEEMLDWHYNHASIILWGCLNEGPSHQKQYRGIYKDVLHRLKTLGGGRPTTFASMRWDKDLCFDLADVVSLNLYPGWYGKGKEFRENVPSHIKRFLHWLRREAPKDVRTKPFIVSEIGGGAIYGCRQRQASKWSEDYQAMLMEQILGTILPHKDIAGLALWQFMDCRVTDDWSMSRPRTYNNKGTLDEYRRPKLAYDVVKRHMHEAIRRQAESGNPSSSRNPKSSKKKR